MLIAVPFSDIGELAPEPLAGKIVMDASNCYSQRDGSIEALSDFPSKCLLTRTTQTWSFSPDTHILLKNKKKLAHPTRFERVTFAFGAI